MPVCSWFLVWILDRFQALLRPGGLWVRGDSGDTGVQHSAECQPFCYRLPYDLSWHQFRPCCAVEPITSTAVILSLLPQWFHHSFTNFEYNITPPLKDPPHPPTSVILLCFKWKPAASIGTNQHWTDLWWSISDVHKVNVCTFEISHQTHIWWLMKHSSKGTALFLYDTKDGAFQRAN